MIVHVRFAPKADKLQKLRLVRFVPKADICIAAKWRLLDHLVGGDKQPRRHGQAELNGRDW
jgi:hypothetical protein